MLMHSYYLQKSNTCISRNQIAEFVLIHVPASVDNLLHRRNRLYPWLSVLERFPSIYIETFSFSLHSLLLTLHTFAFCEASTFLAKKKFEGTSAANVHMLLYKTIFLFTNCSLPSESFIGPNK